MNRTLREIAAAFMVMVFGVGGCTSCATALGAEWSPPRANEPAPESDWTPPKWQGVFAEATSLPKPLEATGLGLVERRLRNDEIGLQARWEQLPGAGSGNAAIVEAIRGIVSLRGESVGVAYQPKVFARGAGLAARGCVTGSTAWPAAEVVADPATGPIGGSGVAVVCDIVFASGSVLGQRLRVLGAQDGMVTSDTSRVFYFDTCIGEGGSGAQLWAPGAAEALWAGIAQSLRRQAGLLSLAPIAAGPGGPELTAGLLESTEVGPNGTLLVSVPAGFNAPELAALGITDTLRSSTWAVPREVAEPLLSVFGVQVVAAAGAPFIAPAPVAAGLDLVGCDLLPCVAMTYDDGPGELTAGVLDQLAARHASASFFLIGARVAGNADLARRMVAEGHVVGNHTWSHTALSKTTVAKAADELRRTDAAILAATGVPVTVFRPPWGEYNEAVLAVAGKPAILWDVDTFDWRQPSDEVLIGRAVDQPIPGSVVLQHDIHPNTGRTAGRVYDGLLDRGFVLVNLQQLYNGQLPVSGARSSGR